MGFKLVKGFLVVAVVAFFMPGLCGAQVESATSADVAAQVENLELEIRQLRSEMSALSALESPQAVISVDSKTGGKGFGRIVGGVPVPAGSFPDCAAVGDGFDYYCTGTLISPSLVVTAAHCLPGVQEVFLGGNSLFMPGSGEKVRVREERIHPSADIAVLVLEEESTVQPAQVGQDCHVSGANEAIVAGFGTTNFAGTLGYGTKRYVPDLPIADADCSDPAEYGCVSGEEMVAGLRGLDKDSCKGDSGGPLYVQHNGRQLLIGATSRGARGASRVCGDGGIYVRVDKFVDWIEDVTGEVIAQAACF